MPGLGSRLHSFVQPITARVVALLPVGVILLTLVSLTVLPVVLERRLSTLHTEIEEVAEPAREEALTIQLAVALETAGTRGYLATGSPSFAAKHLEARERRKAALRRLQALAPGVSEEVAALAETLAEQFGPADAVLDSLFERQLPREEFLSRLPPQQGRLEAVLSTVRTIDERISATTAGRLDRMQQEERRALWVTVVLMMLGVLSVTLVMRLELSYRTLVGRERAAREEAEYRREEQERLQTTRARFMRGFTHDLKSPLSAADSFLALQQDGLVAADVAATKARQGIASAVRLIRDILELERVQSGMVALHLERVDLVALVRSVADENQARVASKGLRLEVRRPDGQHVIRTDPGRLTQILRNLVGNAVQYTTAGSVSVSVRILDVGPAAACWAFLDVQDTGPGIAKEDLTAMFEEFRRGNSSGATAGTGLGLAISKQLAVALGGDLTAESTPGVGSTFVLRLPCDRPSGELQGACSEPPAAAHC